MKNIIEGWQWWNPASFSAYKVATQLFQLQSLFPGRIKAGVGRSPGRNETNWTMDLLSTQ
ncbi:UNVERIFIED_ORG: alkanesulfonate monooxygenase SsuD/methylene tetrahydromethanopterin reductase-like flavin-dependent oxidoreductase (luciferase family) [Peribacillus simplex]